MNSPPTRLNGREKSRNSPETSWDRNRNVCTDLFQLRLERWSEELRKMFEELYRENFCRSWLDRGLNEFPRIQSGIVAEAAGFLFQAPGWSDTLNRAQGTQVKDYQLAGGVNRFQTTRWSVVLVSAQSQAPGYREAFADLCKLYWYPLYAFIRHRGYSPEDAQDLVQGFFLHLLEYKALSRVDRSKGKFRSFLLASLQNYLSNEADRARCLKRGGKAEFVYLDIDGAEDRYGLEPVEKLTPEKIPPFDCGVARRCKHSGGHRAERR
jgi:Sigma-70 region 2